ncbi:MAG: hypothetical protein BIFFINMI_03538 [Phycisphaerae bacterium]|nr:hypothetical protein [Phycisphaerae bacterium]
MQRITCRNCGAGNDADATTCTTCGAPLKSAAAPPPAPAVHRVRTSAAKRRRWLTTLRRRTYVGLLSAGGFMLLAAMCISTRPTLQGWITTAVGAALLLLALPARREPIWPSVVGSALAIGLAAYYYRIGLFPRLFHIGRYFWTMIGLSIWLSLGSAMFYLFSPARRREAEDRSHD